MGRRHNKLLRRRRHGKSPREQREQAQADHMMTTTEAWIKQMQREREQQRSHKHGTVSENS